MQLLILALLLLASGKNANLKEFEPILESIGGEEAADAIKRAEELSGIISAVQSLTANPPKQACREAEDSGPCGGAEDSGEVESGATCGSGYPLAPIAGIADEKIMGGLSRYLAVGD